MMEEEEQGTPMDFQRLISVESVSSVQSSDSCEYYHTEIFGLLPSSQAHRQQKHKLHPDDEQRMLESSVPPKALPVCMQNKRHIRSKRAERRQQKHHAGTWDSWTQNEHITRWRLKEHMSRTLSGLLLWRQTLYKIEGQFGVGVKAYFVFLRYLLCLNVLYCVIIGGSVLTPTLMFREKSMSDQSFGFKDIFVGSGFLEESPVFHSFYTRGSLDFHCLNIPILFLLCMVSVLFLSIIMVVRRTVMGYKNMWLTGNRFSSNMSYKIFCGWDFCIQNEKAAALKHTFIRNELKMDLGEQHFHEKVQTRTMKRWIQLILLRIVLNILVLLLLASSFILIHYTITLSHHWQDQNLDWISSLMWEYLPPVTMTSVNCLLPHIFRETSKYEDYSPVTQLNLTLIRSIFLKLASLGIYLSFLIAPASSQGAQHKCGENAFGKEMYKLIMFNLLESFFSAFCLAYPRMLLVKRFSWLRQKLGMPQFDISLNVLELVNSQTVTWVGVFYCPLLPAISVARLLLLFYIKKFTLMHYCVRAQRIFRVASSSVLFHFMLLLGLFLSVIILGVRIQSFDSGSCGPFEGNNVFNVTAYCIKTLPASAQTTISYVTSTTFAFTLILTELVILTSYMSRGRANSKAIERLKEMLVMCSSDKRFLAKKHNTMRRQKTTR